MWITLALVAALGTATTSFVLKQAVTHGGALVSTVAFRGVAGLVLVGVIGASGTWPTLTPAYWRAALLVIPPEVGGMVCLTLALRRGELSLVQPVLGLLPLFVMAGGAVFLQEIPTPLAVAGILLVTAGIYCVGHQGGRSLLDPLRNLTHERASWYAIGAALLWSLTTVLHKVGISEVGAFPWAVTLTLGSAAALAVALPFLAWSTGSLGLPTRAGPWVGLVVLAGLFFALQQAGLHLSLRIAQAGYVVAVTSTSVLLATALGILLLGERSSVRNRILGGLLVCSGTVLVALFG